MSSIFLQTAQDNKCLEVCIGDRILFGEGKQPRAFLDEGIINEISPSGEFVKIDYHWYCHESITLFDHLPDI